MRSDSSKPKAGQFEYKSPQGEKRVLLSRNQQHNEQILSRLKELGVSYIVASISPDGKATVNDQADAIKTVSELLR